MTDRSESAETLDGWLRVPDAKAIEGLTEDALDLSGGSNGWSIRENVHHLVEANLVASNIVVAALAQSGCTYDWSWMMPNASWMNRVRHGTGGTSARDAQSAVPSYSSRSEPARRIRAASNIPYPIHIPAINIVKSMMSGAEIRPLKSFSPARKNGYQNQNAKAVPPIRPGADRKPGIDRQAAVSSAPYAPPNSAKISSTVRVPGIVKLVGTPAANATNRIATRSASPSIDPAQAWRSPGELVRRS